MKKNHILLVGEDRNESLSIGLMVESFNNRITIIEDKKSITNNIAIFQNRANPIDLLLIGSKLTSKEINRMFSNFKKHKLNFPFIILTNKKKFSLINNLLEKGFYGYMVKPGDTVLLMHHIQTLFKNIDKYVNYNG
ncbi:MAG: hypothetical protein KAR14_05770 [Candidatus Aminicenantes bacterium]|nr:hypothetical protein [Candidatus Aminicenantes bacterium]